jgi:hypothetical protein
MKINVNIFNNLLNQLIWVLVKLLLCYNLDIILMTDSETYKLMLQVQRLTQENSWLRDELSLMKNIYRLVHN